MNGRISLKFSVPLILLLIIGAIGSGALLYPVHQKVTEFINQEDRNSRGERSGIAESNIQSWPPKDSVVFTQDPKNVNLAGEDIGEQWTYEGGAISYAKIQSRIRDFYFIPSSSAQLDLALDCSGRENLLRSHRERLQDILETQDIQTIDIGDIRFMTDESLTRQEKIAVYWSLLEQQNDPLLFSLLIDGIQSFYPIELTKAIIPLYDKFSDIEAKKKIVQLLLGSTSIADEPDKLSAEQLEFVSEQKQAAQELYFKVMYDATIPEAAREAFISSPWVVDPQDMMKVLQLIEDKDLSLQHMHEALTQSDYDDVWVRTIFANKEMQNTYVPQVLSKLQTLVKNEGEGAIRLYHYLPLNGQALDKNSKDVLLGTLMEHKPPIVSSDITFPDWLEAVAAISSTTKAESRRYVEDYIMVASPQEIASYLTSNPSERNGFVAVLQEEKKRQLTRKIHLELKQNSRDRSWDSTYRWALKVLKH